MSLNCPRQTPSPQKESERERENRPQESPPQICYSCLCAGLQTSRTLLEPTPYSSSSSSSSCPNENVKGPWWWIRYGQVPLHTLICIHTCLNGLKRTMCAQSLNSCVSKRFWLNLFFKKNQKTFYGTFLFFVNKINKPKYRLV